MNILIVTETYVPTVSGVANSTDSIARYLVSRGHTVTVIAPAPLAVTSIALLKGLTVATTPSIRDPLVAGKPMTLFPLGFGTIWKTVHKNTFDVMHIQEPGSLGITALIIAKITHIPTVGAAHAMPEQVATLMGPLLYRFGLVFADVWFRIFYNQFDAVMTPTGTMVGYLKHIGIQRPIHAVSNGINIHEFTPGKPNLQIKLPFTLPKEVIYFGYLGRIDSDKHLDVVIRALTHTDPQVHLVIAGFGRALPELEGMTNELHIRDKVTFIGKLSEREILELYRLLDCFIIPSPVESQSIVTLEAIACGLPVIAARAGALPELVHDGMSGFLVAPDDDGEFANKMNKLAGDAELRKKFGEKGRSISLLHDKPKALHKLEQIYFSLL